MVTQNPVTPDRWRAGFWFLWLSGNKDGKEYGVQSGNKYDWLTTEYHAKDIKNQILNGVIYLLMDGPETT